MARQEGVSYIDVGRSRKSAALSSVLLLTTPGAPSATGLLTLHTFPIAKGTIPYTASALKIKLSGLIGDNANNKTFTLVLGSSTIFTATVGLGDGFSIEGTLTRRSVANSVHTNFIGVFGSAAGVLAASHIVFTGNVAENFDTDLSLLLRVNAATSATDINVHHYMIEAILAGYAE